MIDMNWTIDINVVIQVLTLTAAAGMGWQKLKQIEKDVERLESELNGYRELRADLMVIKNQISNLADKIDNILRSDSKEHGK